ncbi:MAG: DUF4493 domain-containing protein [Bacteroidales bacterium]|nr:DUF4493 domain-containing protein [Bacteroidales bacterium]
MKLNKNIYLGLALTMALASCSKEDPFFPVVDEAEGQILKSALNVSVPNPDGITVAGRPVLTRAAAPVADDFTVDFIKNGESSPVRSYKYSEMPEVVTLPVGAYSAVARYGENLPQAWEAPYYAGQTSFVVVADKITSDVEPINARLSNVRVSIVFAPSLLNNMDSSAKVTVKVGESGTLDFTPADADRSGYFAYVENSSTLTATFSGDVEGIPVVESKVYDTVAPGSHYRITFRMHDAGEDDPGSIDAGLSVDASVEIVDMNVTIDGNEEDEILEDDLRPSQGNPDPVLPTDPTDPTVPGDKAAPKATSLEPIGDYAGFTRLDLDKVNEVTDNLYCAWKVTSEAEGGFKKFDVKIISDTLTPSELAGVGLQQDLDLINPGQFEESLSGLGFPVNLEGKSEAEFDITGFLTLMAILGPGDHEFRLTVADANGTSVISVRLHTK